MELSGEWCDYREKFAEIRDTEAPDSEKLALAFGDLTRFIIKDTERQVELARASRDKDEAVKQQIKLETLKHARRLFETCYRQITGKQAWNEKEQR